MNYSIERISKRRTTLLLLFVFVQSHIFTFLILKLTFYDLADDLEIDLESLKQYYKSILPVKIPYNWVLHMRLNVFVQNDIFAYLTLRLTSDLEDDLE